MTRNLLSDLTNPQTIIAILVTVAVFATLYTLITPFFERKDFAKRMKAVSSERELIRSRERERLTTATRDGKTSLRGNNNKSARRIVEKFNLREALADKNTMNKLRAAGFRSQNALNTFLAARFSFPFIFLAVAFTWVFILGNLADQAFVVRLMAVPVRAGARFEASPPTVVFEGHYFAGVGRSFDVSPDGQRFLMISANPSADARFAPSSLILVQNWAGGAHGVK